MTSRPPLTLLWSRAICTSELKRWLARQGCTFESKSSGHGHLKVYLGDRRSELPMHGSRKELGPKLVARIKKDLGLQ